MRALLELRKAIKQSENGVRNFSELESAAIRLWSISVHLPETFMYSKQERLKWVMEKINNGEYKQIIDSHDNK